MGWTYMSRDARFMLSKIGSSMHVQSRESSQSEGLEERACGVKAKEKNKDNGYTEVQEVCVNSLVCW